MDPVIVTVVIAAVVQVVGLVGVAWSLASRLARMEATMVTVAVCEGHRNDCRKERGAQERGQRLDPTGPVPRLQPYDRAGGL